jgi:predicted DNA-binding transcriptional regulator AlpA
MQKGNIKMEDLPEVMDVKDVMLFLGVSRNNAYKLVKGKLFRSVLIGRRIKIPKKSFVRWYMGDNEIAK